MGPFLLADPGLGPLGTEWKTPVGGLGRRVKVGVGVAGGLLSPPGNQALLSDSFKSWRGDEEPQAGKVVGHLECDLGPGNRWGWQGAF